MTGKKPLLPPAFPFQQPGPQQNRVSQSFQRDRCQTRTHPSEFLAIVAPLLSCPSVEKKPKYTHLWLFIIEFYVHKNTL